MAARNHRPDPAGWFRQPPRPQRQPDPQPSGDEVSLIAQAVDAAVHTLGRTIEALPPPDDPDFTPRVTAILSDLRQLEAVAARAARIGRVTPALLQGAEHGAPADRRADGAGGDGADTRHWDSGSTRPGGAPT